MYGFLRSPRWLVGHVVVLVSVVSFVVLGSWQLRRLDERRAFNDLVTDRGAAEPIALDAAVSADGRDPAALEYRQVTVTGRYVSGAQVLTAPRSREGQPGPHVLTVLDTDAGPDLLVDRGWVPLTRDLAAPAPPSGQVTLSGTLRSPETGNVGQAEQVLRIAPDAVADRLDRPLLDTWLALETQRPALTAAAPLPTPAESLGEGNHLSYAIQWFGFAIIALVGYPLLVVRTARERRRSHDGPAPPTSAGTAGGASGPGWAGGDARLP